MMCIDTFRFGCSCTPAYVTGDRTGSITSSSTASLSTGPASLAVNGVTSDSTGILYAGQAVANLEMWKGDWGAGVSIKITEVKLYLGNSTGSLGVWKFQGSADDSSWTDVGTDISPIGIQTLVDSSMSANASGYRYYRYVGVSGTAAGSGRSTLDELEFKQCTC